MEKYVEIQKSVKYSFSCLSYTWNLVCTQHSFSDTIQMQLPSDGMAHKYDFDT